MTEAELREKVFDVAVSCGTWVPRTMTNNIMDLVAPLLVDSKRLDFAIEWLQRITAMDTRGRTGRGWIDHYMANQAAIAAEKPEEKPDVG